MSRSPQLAALAAAAALLAAGSGACAKKHDLAPQAVPVKVQIVEAPAGGAGQRYSATIWPEVQVDLAFKVSGYIETIHEVNGPDGRRRSVQAGDVVSAGSVLARVRDGEYRDKLEESRASLTKARGDFERAAQLYEKKTVSKADYDAAASQLAASQARFNQAETTLDDCALKATMGGRVIERTIEVGSLVSPGSKAFVLADTRAVRARFGVSDAAVGNLRLGASQSIRCEAVPGRVWTGTITRIAPSADPSSRVFDVECTVPNEDERLRPGMVATVEMAGGSAGAAGAATVPLSAIVRPRSDPAGYAVYVVDDAAGQPVARERVVALGAVVGNRIAITSGLAAGEMVVAVGATLLVDAQPVTIIP